MEPIIDENLPDRFVSDLDPELVEFALNANASPVVLFCHLEDDCGGVLGDRRPPRRLGPLLLSPPLRTLLPDPAQEGLEMDTIESSSAIMFPSGFPSRTDSARSAGVV